MKCLHCGSSNTVELSRVTVFAIPFLCLDCEIISYISDLELFEPIQKVIYF